MIKNTFRFARDFRYVIDPELIKRKKEFKFRWMRVDPKYPEKLMELKVVMEPYPHIHFELKRGEEVHIVNYIGLEKGVRIEKPFNINFNIEMGAMKVRRLFSIRLNGLTRMRYRPFSGVVMRIMEGSFTLKGTLKSRDKKLLNEAVIIVKTIDGRQSAATRVNEKGDWIFKDINPDIYQVWAKAGKLESKRVIVHGQPVKKALPDKPVVLEL